MAKRLQPTSERVSVTLGERASFEAECTNPASNLDRAEWWRKPPGEAESLEVNDSAFLQMEHWSKLHSFRFDEPGEWQVIWRCFSEEGAVTAASWAVSVVPEQEEPSPPAETTPEQDAGSEPSSASQSSDPEPAEEAPEASAEEGKEPPASAETSESSTIVTSSPGEVRAPGGEMSVTFVDVGQGDAIVVRFPDATLVVDTGNRYGSSHDLLLSHLQDSGTSSIDALVITHPDADHSGGCDELLVRHDIAAILHPGIPKDTQTWQDCADAIRAEGADVFTDEAMDPGHYLRLSDHAEIHLLHVDASDASEPNEGSVVLHVVYGAFDLLLTGDIGCDTEREILARDLVRDVDVLKVAHHGSRYSTCDEWLDASLPEHAVISVGDNSYGHPTQEILDRLASRQIETFRTDLHGDVTLTTDGSTWSLASERSPEPAPTHPEPQPEPEPTPEPTPEATAADVSVSGAQFDAPGTERENLNGEWVEITNSGSSSQSLAGWRIEDESGHTYSFPAVEIASGAAIKIHTGSGSDTETDLYWGRGSPVWNNGGDTVFLYDARGALVDKWSS